MSGHSQDRQDIAALIAESRRLNVISEVLTDMLFAAWDSGQAKGFRNDAAERSKMAYVRDVGTRVHADLHANWHRLIDAQYGPEKPTGPMRHLPGREVSS
ncbi:hypothetical protein [Nocardia terpenica]|uniref:Uncharacterized protein n=1 Tax=Nocardia terpenica TaxID=455432 RepID=A0A6G9Z234_9NOCA|nr:hypothetical protein [Nocardia terpenica]QIS19568.1 hypothetical protein F6W96_16025 [Nocardia terpenica]